MNSIEQKRAQEWRVVLLMIQVYCHGAHKNRQALKTASALCADCAALADYVHARVERCPFMETKTFCSMCRVHCYRAAEREKIRAVMRYSGPRMLGYHPILALRHVALTMREKLRARGERARGERARYERTRQAD